MRQVSAARVSVGFEVPMVGMLPAPTTKRFGWSQLRWSGSTTDVARSPPMRWVPQQCPAPMVA